MDKELLTKEDKKWLNEYHDEVLAKVGRCWKGMRELRGGWRGSVGLVSKVEDGQHKVFASLQGTMQSFRYKLIGEKRVDARSIRSELGDLFAL